MLGAVAGSMGGGGSEAAPEQQQQMEPMQQQQQQPVMTGACADDKQMFFECLQHNKGDQEACNFLYENLQQCQRNATQMQFS